MIENDSGLHPQNDRLDPPAGEWLFRYREEVLGPLPSAELIQRMFSGEVNEATMLSTGDGEWRRLESLREFQPFLMRAKAKIRAEKARVEAERAARNRRTRNIIKLVIGAAVLLTLSFGISYLLIVLRPWRSDAGTREWAERHVPLLRIPAEKTAANISEPPPEKGSDNKINIDQILIDDAPALVALKHLPANFRRKHLGANQNGRNKPPKPGSDEGPETEEGGGQGAADSSGALSNDEIVSVVYNRSNLNRLYACIRDEAKRNSDLPSKIIISFTINNDGRVGEVRMDDIRLENTSLHQCLREKLTLVKFRSYQGERRNIEVPFNLEK